MDRLLSLRLHVELADRIARQVHEMRMAVVFEVLLHKIVWVRVDGEITWLACEGQNYYESLDEGLS